MDPRSFPGSGAVTPQLFVENEPYAPNENDDDGQQPLTSLLKSLQSAMMAATAIDTGEP